MEAAGAAGQTQPEDIMTGRIAKVALISAMIVGTLAAESRKEYHFNVGPRLGFRSTIPTDRFR